MQRSFSTITLLTLIVLAAPVARAQDTVRYIDPATRKEATTSGTISSETIAKVVVKPTVGSALKEIPATEVEDILYQLALGRGGQQYRRADNSERSLEKLAKPEDRKDALDTAAKNYRDALALAVKFGEAKALQRHLQYKIARTSARLAEMDPAEAGSAIDLLSKFRQDHPDCWQTVHATRALAGLQMIKEDYEGARKTYEELAKASGLPKEVRQECELMVAHTLARAKKYKEAEKLLTDALKNIPANDPQAGRIKVYLAECQAGTGRTEEALKALQTIIDTASENDIKAMAYNKLGDCYLASDRPKDALYSYLWVDIIYNQDKLEHARAMENLAKLFESGSFKDEARAKLYRDKLQKR